MRPERSAGQARLPTIPGVVPGVTDRPTGCLFNPRCRRVQERCRREVPPFLPPGGDEAAADGRVRCFFPENTARPS